MESKYKEPQLDVVSKLGNLPIFSDKKGELIQLDANSNVITDNPKSQKYETIAKFGVIAGVLLLGTILLPFIIGSLALWIVAAIMFGIVALGFMFYPVIKMKALNYADDLYRKEITRDPISYIQKKAKEAHHKKKLFTQSKHKIKQLAENAQTEALVQSNNVKEYEDRLVGFKARVDKERVILAEIEAANPGEPYKDPRYEAVELNLQKLAGDVTINENYRKSSASLAKRYGNKYNEFNNLYKKLNKYDVSLEVYLNKLDSSVKIFEEELAFVKAGKEATNIANSIMGLSSDWEAAYAANYLTQMIDNDLAQISANIEDIDRIANSDGLDSSTDETLARLDRIVGEISDGETMSVDVSKYNDPNYVATAEDRLATRSVRDVIK